MDIFLMVMTCIILLGVFRYLSFKTLTNKYVTEGDPKILTLGKWWYLLYSVYKYDIEKDININKIRQDINKGVPEMLANLREKSVALQMIQYEFSNNYNTKIVLRDEEGLFWEDLNLYTEYILINLANLEEEYELSQMLNSWEDEDLSELIRSLEDPDSFNEEDNNEK